MMLYLEKSYIGNGDITLWLYKVYRMDLNKDYFVDIYSVCHDYKHRLVYNKSTPGIHLAGLTSWAYCP